MKDENDNFIIIFKADSDDYITSECVNEINDRSYMKRTVNI